MDRIDYSVVIRTTGNAHEKYQRLLDSIQALEPQPRETIVVLPEGYSLPDERIGSETFIFAPKGMVSQRLTGIRHCQSPYALVCDDDVCFGPDFVKKLHEPLAKKLGGISAGPLYSFLPSGFAETVFDLVRGAAVPTIWHRDRYVSVLKTTGYSYNRHLRAEQDYYESQSVAGTCFFIDVEAFKSVQLEDEKWIDAHGYAAMEDQVMIYKAWLRGWKTIVVTNAHYEHLDAKTSTRNKNPNVPYSRCFNRFIFWHRFIYTQQNSVWKKFASRCAWNYRLLWEHIYEVLNVLRGRITSEEYHHIQRAWREGREYVKSAEYQKLPRVE